MNKRCFSCHTVLIAMTLFVLPLTALSQGFYVKGSGGYLWGMGDHYYSWGDVDVLGQLPFYAPVQNVQESIKGEVHREVLQASYGKGLSYGVGVGFMFSSYLGVELGISYLRGENIQSVSYSSSKGTYHQNNSKAFMWNFCPALKISAGRTGINPYTRLGVIIGTPTIETAIINNNVGTVTIYGDKIDGGAAIGFQGTVGVEYPINGLIAVFWELNYSNVKYKPTQRTVTEYNLNNADILTSKYPESTTELVKEADISEIYPSGNKHLTQPLPFGNLGMHVGLAIHFGK